MNRFRFCPELFQYRSDAMEALSGVGFEWFSDYSSIDLLHDLFGLEVCGIRSADEASAIRKVLLATFPGWRAG